ncbi:MAG: hypothetical protein ACTHK1_02940, partial [Actinomycetales bacterium]
MTRPSTSHPSAWTRWGRCCLLALSVAVTAAGLAPVSSAPARAAVGAATARPSTAVGAATAVGTEAGVDISLDEISPSAPQPGDTLVVRGTVRNGTAATLQG